MGEKRSRMSRDDRREVLLQAACELFAEKGYDGTMLKDIAERAGVSKSLMPVYFTDKNEIYMQLFERWAEQEKLVVRFEIVDNSAIQTLSNALQIFIHDPAAIYRMAGRDETLSRAINSRYEMNEMKSAATREGSDLMEDSILPIIVMGQQQGEIVEGDPKALAFLFQCTAFSLGELCRKFPDRFYAPAAEQMIELLRKK